jgi:hypothetical protein
MLGYAFLQLPIEKQAYLLLVSGEPQLRLCSVDSLPRLPGLREHLWRKAIEAISKILKISKCKRRW